MPNDRYTKMLLAASTGVSPESPAGSAGAHRWSRQEARGVWGRDVLVIQVPHFSRFSSTQGLARCGQWLRDILVTESF